MRDYVTDPFARHSGPVRQAIRCADGVTYSVQASSVHYCSPKDDLDAGARYQSVEVWGRRRDGCRITGKPEGWVPLGKINRRIHRHGGPVELYHAIDWRDGHAGRFVDVYVRRAIMGEVLLGRTVVVPQVSYELGTVDSIDQELGLVFARYGTRATSEGSEIEAVWEVVDIPDISD